MEPEAFLSALRLARLRRGLTQFALARKTGLASSRLSLLERGQIDSTARDRALLTVALRVPESELFPPNPDEPAEVA